MTTLNAFGRAIAALGVGIAAVGHWFWIHQHHSTLPRASLWAMNGAFDLYAGIFLIGVGVHALASECWLSDLNQPNQPASSVQEPRWCANAGGLPVDGDAPPEAGTIR